MENNSLGKKINLSPLHRIRQWLLDNIEIIKNIGTENTKSDWEYKRTRILNGISAYTVLIFLGYVFFAYSLGGFNNFFFECLVPFFAYTSFLVLNYFGYYLTSIVSLLVFSGLLFSYFSLAHGEADAAEYLLLCNSVSSMIFFRRFRVIISFFILNVMLFWLVKFLYDYIPAFSMHPGPDFYVENHIFTFLGLFVIVYYFKAENNRSEDLLEDQHQVLISEKEKSDKLLLNILPKEISDELKKYGKSEPKSFEKVSVLFADFQNFKLLSTELSPEELVALLNQYFQAFDRILLKHGVEKIKSIGSAYMCAYGLRKEDRISPKNMIAAAIEMQLFVINLKAERLLLQKPYFEMKLGIHSGPVIAGIVGKKKFAFDLWGDTVNIASRMQSSGEIDCINVSKKTFELIRTDYACEYRGKIQAKNKGKMDMYFVYFNQEADHTNAKMAT